MSIVDILWQILRDFFHLTASILASGLGESGGRVMAVLLFAALLFLSGVFKTSRRVVGPLLAFFIALVALSVVIN